MDFYKKNGEPIKCTNCGSKELLIKTIAYVNNIPCEQECYCSECGKVVGYWAYGYWNPDYINERSD